MNQFREELISAVREVIERHKHTKTTMSRVGDIESAKQGDMTIDITSREDE